MSADQNTINEEPTFPCTQCGACCRVLDTIDCDLPYDETGRCDYLVDTAQPDGRLVSLCSIYDTRADHGCPTLNSVKYPDMSWIEYYEFMIKGCNLLQARLGVDESYNPQLDPALFTQPPRNGE